MYTSQLFRCVHLKHCFNITVSCIFRKEKEDDLKQHINPQLLPDHVLNWCVHVYKHVYKNLIKNKSHHVVIYYNHLIITSHLYITCTLRVHLHTDITQTNTCNLSVTKINILMPSCHLCPWHLSINRTLCFVFLNPAIIVQDFVFPYATWNMCFFKTCYNLNGICTYIFKHGEHTAEMPTCTKFAFTVHCICKKKICPKHYGSFGKYHLRKHVTNWCIRTILAPKNVMSQHDTMHSLK